MELFSRMKSKGYLSNCQTNFVIVFHELVSIVWHFKTQQLTTWAVTSLYLPLTVVLLSHNNLTWN